MRDYNPLIVSIYVFM